MSFEPEPLAFMGSIEREAIEAELVDEEAE